MNRSCPRNLRNFPAWALELISRRPSSANSSSTGGIMTATICRATAPHPAESAFTELVRDNERLFLERMLPLVERRSVALDLHRVNAHRRSRRGRSHQALLRRPRGRSLVHRFQSLAARRGNPLTSSGFIEFSIPKIRTNSHISALDAKNPQPDVAGTQLGNPAATVTSVEMRESIPSTRTPAPHGAVAYSGASHAQPVLAISNWRAGAPFLYPYIWTALRNPTTEI